MACIKWSRPVFISFGRNVILIKHSPERSLSRNSRIDFFLPTAKPHPLNPLTEGPPPMYWLGTSWWCPRPCARATTICVCLILLSCHSCRSCVVLLYYVYWVLFVSCGVRGVWAFRLTLPSFVPPWTSIVWAKAYACIAHWASTSAITVFTLSIGLMAVSLAIRAYWVCYILPGAFSTHLLYLYILFLPRAY